MEILSTKLTNTIANNVKHGSWVENIIFGTYDYSIFKNYIGVQRDVKQSNVKSIIESIEIKEMILPIIVNENMQVIDGHHLLIARKQSKLPIYYTILEGYSEKEIRLINSHRKNWMSIDLLKSYQYDLKSKVYPYVETICIKNNIPSNIVNLILSKNTMEGTKSNNRTLQKQLFKDDTTNWANLDTVVKRIGIYKKYAKSMRSHRYFYSALFANPKLDCTELEKAVEYSVHIKMLMTLKKIPDMNDTIKDLIAKFKRIK